MVEIILYIPTNPVEGYTETKHVSVGSNPMTQRAWNMALAMGAQPDFVIDW